MKSLRWVLPVTCLMGLMALGLLSSCSTGAFSGGRSVYGDRAGPSGFRTVIIDAGHGGKDSGARARGLVEKTLALDFANRLKRELDRDFRVVMVRRDDRFVDLDDRVKRVNGYGNAILVSLHFNYGARWMAGPETYYWRSDSYALAKRIQRAMSDACPYERGNRGLVRRRLRLTRNPLIPCVLVEGGYLTNSSDAGRISTSAYRQRLAQAVASAIRSQRANGDGGMGPIPKPIYAPPSKATDARDRF